MILDCDKCRASGVYFSRRCVSCLGKGYLNERDQMRRVRWMAFGKRVTRLPYAD